MSPDITRVLVVEDDRDFAESLTIALGTRKCEVEIAYTGEDAIRMFHERAYDIAFMDIKLPGKNGVESLTEILAFAPRARIVMMTGYSEPALLDQARRAGAVDVLRKPFRMRDLLGFIDRLQGGGTQPPVLPAIH
ncbi:MAG: response regulator [Deltaproteobacteria bacterium]|nr:MAG: response regulator [Deltaproteobacteria bacterium]